MAVVRLLSDKEGKGAGKPVRRKQPRLVCRRENTK